MVDFVEPRRGHHEKSHEPINSKDVVQVKNLGGHAKESIPRRGETYATAWWCNLQKHYIIDSKSFSEGELQFSVTNCDKRNLRNPRESKD